MRVIHSLLILAYVSTAFPKPLALYQNVAFDVTKPLETILGDTAKIKSYIKNLIVQKDNKERKLLLLYNLDCDILLDCASSFPKVEKLLTTTMNRTDLDLFLSITQIMETGDWLASYERNILLDNFITAHVRLQCPGKKLDKIVFTQMKEVKVLYNETYALLYNDKDVLSLFDELKEKKLKISKELVGIKAAYVAFKVLLRSVWIAKSVICKIANGMYETIRNDVELIDLVELKKFVDGDERLQVAEMITKTRRVWKKRDFKQRLIQCNAEMKALLAD